MAIRLAAAICLIVISQAYADPVVESAQQTLKDQGFYYGEITGTKDADTTAAIRRYQIRNGLQVTGDLNAETAKSLGLKGGAHTPRSTPSAAPRPQVAPPQPTPPDTSDLRDNAPIEEEEAPVRDNTVPEIGDLFDGTPFESAPLEVQQRVVMDAQAVLARRGYYRSDIDGIFGPGTEFALRAYQARFGITQTGRFNTETLAALGLLPGQRAPGITAPRRRTFRPPLSVPGPDGERVYIPR